MASHFRALTIEDVRRETADCISVAFAIPPGSREEFRWRQGQNITLRTRINGEEIRRSYSICSSPLDNELRVAIKKVPGGVFSTFANEQLQKGHVIDVLPPSGKFYTELLPENRKRYLAFAAGSGITPILSLIKTTLAVEPGSHFTLVYGNRHRGSILFREELEGLKNRYMDRLSLLHILSREQMDEVFLCGPEEMIFMLKGWLEQQGVEARKLHFELFHTRDAAGAAAFAPGETGGGGLRILRNLAGGSEGGIAGSGGTEKVSRVTVRLDGVSHEFDLPYNGSPLLDAALMEGVDLPFACKGGVCCTCRARLVEGQVEMEVNYALEADELAAGFILTCQSHPRTDRVTVDFDSK